MTDTVPANSLVNLRGLYCPHCEYDLRGNESDICPECGRRFNRRALMELAGYRCKWFLGGPIIMSIIFPPIGVIALYFSLKTWRARKRSDYAAAYKYSAKTRYYILFAASGSLLFMLIAPVLVGIVDIFLNIIL